MVHDTRGKIKYLHDKYIGLNFVKEFLQPIFTLTAFNGQQTDLKPDHMGSTLSSSHTKI